MGAPAQRKVDRRLFGQLVLLAVAMFGFGFPAGAPVRCVL